VRVQYLLIAVLAALAGLVACETTPTQPGLALTNGSTPVPPAPANPAIAYQRENGTKPDNVMVMNADGSSQAAVFTGLAFTGFTWSPDGQEVVFGGGVDGVFGVYGLHVAVVNGVATGSNARLIQSGFQWGDPQWSPNGDLIAVTGQVPGADQSGILTFPAGGGVLAVVYTVPVPSSIRHVNWATWSPDQTRIAFTEIANVDASSTLRIIDVSTGLVTNVTSAPGLIRWPDWSHDGSRIAYSMQSGRTENVYTISATPGATPSLVGSGYGPSWTPADDRLVINVAGQTDLIGVVSSGGGTVTVLGKNGRVPDSR
jgi:Tol biopolymer transport system component